MSNTNECITVVVRCRPMNRKEKDENRQSIITVDHNEHTVSIRNHEQPDEPIKSFTYDASYDENTLQRDFYDESCFSIIESALEGFNSTIFAYGQTGCGKSFTMQGPNVLDEEMRGVIPNSFLHIFQCIKSNTNGTQFLIRCSYLELYNEEIRDLLISTSSSKQQNKNNSNHIKCELKEDPQKGIYVKGLTMVVVETPEDLFSMFDKGLLNRTVASTQMNSESSRSHSIFTIIIEMNIHDNSTKKDLTRVGKLNLVDLAGSERVKKTGAKEQTLKEGIKINLSLSVLGNVISALAEGGRHIPYRDSKLTRLLQDSLGGNTKTMMIAAISPADYNYEETLSTLRYANRAKNIKNKPKINEDPKDTMIREFKAEIEMLRKLLSEQANAATIVQQLSLPMNEQSSTENEQEQQHQEQKKKMIASSNAESKQEVVDCEKNDDKASIQKENHTAGIAISPRSNTSPTVNIQTPTRGDADEEYGGDDFEAVSPNPVHNPADEPEGEELDQRMRDEVANRLHQLEHLLVSNTSAADEPSIVSVQGNRTTTVAKSAEEVAEEEEALRVYREKQVAARNRREEKERQEMQRVLDEKRLLEEELEELRAATSAPVSSSNAASEYTSEREAKLKKKYARKLQTMTDELRDVREEAAFERKRLMDSMVEAAKDAKLYEMICHAVLAEKDLRRIIERSRYDEEMDDWIIPVVGKKSIDSLITSSGNSGFTSSSGGTLLPDINQNNRYSAGGNDERYGESIVKNPNFNSTVSWSHGGPAGSDNEPHAPTIPRKKRPHRLRPPKGSGVGGIPLLTLPGSLMTVAALDRDVIGDSDGEELTSARVLLASSREDGSPRAASLVDNRKVVPQKPPKSKITKGLLPPTALAPIIPSKPSGLVPNGKGGKIPPLDDPPQHDQAGSGEGAGPIGDWNFFVSNGTRGSAVGSVNGDGDQYSEDEDFISEKDDRREERRRRKKKDNVNPVATAGALPPIDKLRTPRTSLPAI